MRSTGAYSKLLKVGLGTLLVLWVADRARGAGVSAGLGTGDWRLLSQAQVRAGGIYLNELAESATTPLPNIRLGAAPVVGQSLVWTRAQIVDLLRTAAPELATNSWRGATQVRITRRMRFLDEAEVKESLREVLQREFVKERGELELRLTRPWARVVIPDEPFTLNILDLPRAGVTPNFVARFELRAGPVALGSWHVAVQARIWREVWVAGSPLQRGQSLREADLSRERRDVLGIRDPLPSLSEDDPAFELAESVPAGMPLTVRSLRLRPLVHRGRVVDALVQDGALTICVKAEVLEDGLPGQVIRARNLRTKREFRGKVQNEETILVAL